MSERSVAEIIGWSGGHRMAPSGVCAFCGAPLDDALRSWCPHGIGSPTVDDLLAWLVLNTCPDCFTAQFATVEQNSMDGLQASVWSCCEPLDSPIKAPTLLAALEAAVRAVAGES